MLPSLDALCSRAVVDILQNAERADTLVFVGFHAACTKMCELEGVANLGQLGAHDPAAQVPLLGRILQIEQMSTAFVGSYIAQRSIVTMRDMERELVAFLRSYNLQPRTETLGGVTRIALDLATNLERSPSTIPTRTTTTQLCATNTFASAFDAWASDPSRPSSSSPRRSDRPRRPPRRAAPTTAQLCATTTTQLCASSTRSPSSPSFWRIEPRPGRTGSSLRTNAAASRSAPRSRRTSRRS